MSADARRDLHHIRVGLWRLLAELRAGEVNLESAGLQLEAFDSLIDVARVEAETAASKRQANDEAPADESREARRGR